MSETQRAKRTESCRRWYPLPRRMILPGRSFPNPAGIIHTDVIYGADLHTESLQRPVRSGRRPIRNGLNSKYGLTEQRDERKMEGFSANGHRSSRLPATVIE